MKLQKSVAARLAFAAALAAMAGACYGGTLAPTGSPAPTMITVTGYPLDDSPQAAVDFPGNEIVVLAEVETALAPQWANSKAVSGAGPAFIYTPVRIRVTQVLRGSPRLQDGTMILRRLGGRINNVEYVFSDSTASRELVPGREVLLFLGEQRDLGDGSDAATPNMLYVIDGDGIARSSSDRWSTSLGEFLTLLGE